MLQSALRMDKHSRDSNSRSDHKYEWELHIFFDDAFLEGGERVNNYVLTLIEAMAEVHKEKAECLEIVPPDLEGLCIWDTLQKPLLCDYPISVIALYCNKFSHTHTIGLI